MEQGVVIFMGNRYLAFNKKNIMKPRIPNKPGIYRFYDKNGRPIYVGHARKLRHRIQSYKQTDCFKEHPTKKKLRPEIAYVYYNTMPVNKARTLERNAKKKYKFNHL